MKKFKEVINQSAAFQKQLDHFFSSSRAIYALETNEMELFRFENRYAYSNFLQLAHKYDSVEVYIMYTNNGILGWLDDVIKDGSLPPEAYDTITHKIMKANFKTITSFDLQKIEKTMEAVMVEDGLSEAQAAFGLFMYGYRIAAL